MNAEIKARWVAALRSGQYQQGRGTLKSDAGGVNAFCCLGVLCEIAVADGVIDPPVRAEQNSRRSWEYAGRRGCLPDEVMTWAEIDPDLVGDSIRVTVPDKDNYGNRRTHDLIRCNDALLMSFAQIADIIEEQL